jgi:hypothetical protein
MKRRSNSSSEDDGGLDSLLDTMTNVVGILVLVLIVAQMGVADVVSRVVSKTQVDQQMIDSVSVDLRQKEQEKQELQRILYEPLSIDIDQQREELARKKELLERRKKLLAEKEQEQNQYALKIEQDKKRAEQNKREIAESAEQRKELERLITTSLEQKAQLEAMIEQTPNTDAPPDVEITIPNPRPAPNGARQLLLFCVNNQLYPANVERFRKTAEAKAKQLITRYKLLRDPAQGIDPQEFAKRFERLKDQDDFFNVEYFVHEGKQARLRFIPRPNRGAGMKEIANRRSRIYKRWLSGIDPNKYYARFYVLPDSYEIYTATRRAFSEANVLAGWAPQNQNWIYTTTVPGIVLGPPPEPTPQPPPTPPADAPPKKPTPPPNVID